MLVSVVLFVVGIVVGFGGALVHVGIGSVVVAAGAVAYFLRDLSFGIVEILALLALLGSFQGGFLCGAFAGGRARA